MDLRWKETPEKATAQPTSSDICLSCGLCCNGVLYARVNLTPKEEALAEELALPIIEDDAGVRSVPQPCQCFVDERCSIYEQRFGTCRTYRCALLRNVESGHVPAAEALGVIEQARGLLRALYRLLGQQEPRRTDISIWERVSTYLNEHDVLGSPERTAANAKLLLTMRALSLLCHRHFEARIHEKWNENDRHRHPGIGKAFPPVTAAAARNAPNA